ncbi:PAS domain S-box protein [Candidatus Riflebacteria bacterium]
MKKGFEGIRKGSISILLVEDESSHVELLRRSFRSHPLKPEFFVARNFAEAKSILANNLPDLAFIDFILPDGRGTELLSGPLEEQVFPAIIMTGHGDEALAVEAMKTGALDYIVKSETFFQEFPHIVARALREWQIIRERKEARKRQNIATRVLKLLNRNPGSLDLIKQLLALIKEEMQFEAVGLRLEEGEDFPFYVHDGFPGNFIEGENYLCARDQAGEIIRDSCGNVVLECMCGRVIMGRTDPSRPFFTEGGSFWTNSTSELLASTTEEERQARTCNRCNGEGYESVALIPLRTIKENIGLLQINDKRKDLFNPELIRFFEDIGESIGIAFARQEAELNVRTSEMKFRTLFESAGDAIFFHDIEGKILEVNQKTCEHYGYSRDELLKMRVTEIVDPGAPMPVKDWIKEVIKNRRAVFESSHKRSDGSAFPCEVSARLIEDYRGPPAILSIVRDMTGRKRAEEALKESQEAYQDLYDNAPDMFVSVAAKTAKIIKCNNTLAETLGYSKEEILGQSIFDLYTPECREYAKSKVFPEIFKTGKIEVVELQIQKKDGGRIEISANVSVFRDPQGNILYSRSVWRDITEQKRLRQQLMRADKMKSLGILVAGVAHEINNPNNFILLNAPQLQEIWEDLQPILEEYYEENGDFALAGAPYKTVRKKYPLLIEGIIKGGRQINEIVGKLKRFSGIGKASLEMNVPINEILKFSIDIVSPLLKKSTDDFSLKLGKEIPRITGNAGELEQVFINLLSNACQSLEKRSQALRVESFFDSKQNRVIIRFRDEGSGIPGENIDQITDPFFSTRREIGGTGLGLSISYKIIKQHGGTLEFTSEEGKGTTVTISLPV